MIDTTKYTQLLIFKRHWALAVTVALVVMTLAVPVALGAPDIYRATAKLTVERQAASTAAQAAIAGGLETRLDVIRQDALSRAQIIKLITELDLYPELRARTSLDVVIDRVQRDISVVPQTMSTGNGSQVVMSFTVGYVGSDPRMVAAVANRLASFWVEQNSTLRKEQVSQAVSNYKAQLEEAQKHVDDANARLQSYMLNSPSQVPDSLVAKWQELQGVNQDLIAKNSSLTQLKIARNGYTTSIAEEKERATSTGATPDQQKLAQLQARAEQYRQRGERDDGPDLKQLVPQIAQLEAKIKADAASQPDGGSPRLRVLMTSLNDTENELSATTEAVNKLDARAKDLNRFIASAPVRSPQYEGLKNDVGVALESLTAVKKNLDRAILDQVSEKSQDSEEFSILEPARVPSAPWGPPRLNLMIAGLFIAIVLGVGVAVVRDQLDTSFHTLDELRLFTTVPVLGSIPKITTVQQKARRIAVVAAAGTGLIVGLTLVGLAAYDYAQRHEGITRIVTK